jgi:quinolinate synthase
MVERAKASPARKFIVATEKGLVYRLRKEVPEKEFIPVAAASVCDYMKANTFEKLLRSLREDRIEVIFCDDCCDPKAPYQDEAVVHIPRSIAVRARRAIERMLEIK